jgi:hypothetical protein
MTVNIKDKAFHRLIFSVLIGIMSFLLGYFIFDSVVQKKSIRNVIITYNSSKEERAKLIIKRPQEILKCNSIRIDSANKIYQENFKIPDILTFDKLNVSFEKKNQFVNIYSIVIEFDGSIIVWKSENLYDKIKYKNGVKITENGIQISNTWKPIFVELKDPLSNIIQNKHFILICRFSFIFSLLMAIVSFVVINRFKVSYTKKELILTILFISIISTPLLVKHQAYNSFEKKKLVPKPEFKLKDVLSYHRKYGSYFSDNFGFRSTLIKANNYFKYEVLNVSPSPDKVLIGKNDWLFHTQGNSVDYIQNRSLYSTEELEKIRLNIEQKQNWLNKRGIKFYIFVAPIKSRIYPENLPNNVHLVNEKSKLSQLKEYLKEKSDIEIIYPLDELIKGKEKYNTYYSNDTHWTFFGGFIGYSVLMNEIRKDFPNIAPLELEDFVFESTEREANLGNMIGIESLLSAKDDKPFYKYPGDVTLNTELASKIKDSDFLRAPILTENSDTSLLDVVFFRDSFSNFYLTYFGESFSKCLFLWTHKFKPAIIEKGKPDIVVHEIHEVYLDVLLDETYN